MNESGIKKTKNTEFIKCFEQEKRKEYFTLCLNFWKITGKNVSHILHWVFRNLKIWKSCYTPSLNRRIQITNLMNNSFILQQYVCYITILNMFRAAGCSSSGGKIILLQPLVSSLSVNSLQYSNIGIKYNSLTQQCIGILVSTTIDTWAKCFDSIESSSGPQRLQIQLLQGGQVHCGIPNAYIIVS